MTVKCLPKKPMQSRPPIPAMTQEDEQRADALIACARDFGQRGWTPATSGNYSVRLDDGSFLITRSGGDKRRLDRAGLMRLDAAGNAIDPGRASAEAGLHVQIYREYPEVRAVLHVHSPHATVASRQYEAAGALRFRNYELLKAFEGVIGHDVEIELPVVANEQDIDRLAATIEPRLGQQGTAPGYLIAGHGAYAWGRSVADAARHLEALDFLIQCELTRTR